MKEEKIPLEVKKCKLQANRHLDTVTEELNKSASALLIDVQTGGASVRDKGNTMSLIGRIDVDLS